MTSIKAPDLPPLLPFAGRTMDRPSPAPFQGLAVATSGLSAQRLRMEVATANIANAETTRTAEGGPYQRRIVALAPDAPAYGPAPMAMGDYAPMQGGVRVEGIAVDTTPGALVYDPAHPDADAQGYLRMPNVDTTQEIVTLMESRRLYEANYTAFSATKAMLRRAIDI